ncbi:fibroblast growth factor receptor-like 1 [Toxorhynchites rutilus septentrionalis]|uniref:fibroblast growth factor receptor-like 1 n=1 Tax=Toxorhynchites rutilus septentrionalis TaxID=329112 RepID=UPI00247870B6|nr:fibroblast growth factor receptor-like 1 [Toxorhynchites rutilus septentrionalis]
MLSIRICLNVLFVSVVLSCRTMVNCSRASAFYDGNEAMLKLTQSPAGSDVRLKCGIREYHADHMNSSEVRWYFKPCGEGTNRSSCHHREALDQAPWQPVHCDGKRCRVTLSIRNASKSDSGLYRCSIYPYRTDNNTQFDIQLIRTFQLDVIKSILDETVPAPELLDNLPANTTALLDSQVVLQCRIYSKVQPSIKWFRRINLNNNPLEDHNFNQNKSIRYLENTYELVPSSGEKPLSDDVYLSKLILQNVSGRDIGIYVCVGINYGGVNTADAYVNVVYPNGSPVGSGSSMADMMVLFLIPLSLALIPLVGWICFALLKQRKQPPKRAKMDSNGNCNQLAERRTDEDHLAKSSAEGKGRYKREPSCDGSHLYEKIDIV